MAQTGFRYFVILGEMRSGSNLLEQSLARYPGIVTYGEPFNPAFLGKPGQTAFDGMTIADRERDPLALLAALRRDAGDALGGFRLFSGHDPRILDHVLADPDCGKIVLRRDPLESYVSLRTAEETGQWLLRESTDRRTATVDVEPGAFAAFRDAHDAYYARLRQALAESGQSALWLEYPEQKELSVLNGIARFLGVDTPLEHFEEPLRHQNPEPLSDRIGNFETLARALAEDLRGALARPARTEPERGARVRHMMLAPSSRLLFAPIPGTAIAETEAAMAAAGSEPVVSDLSLRELTDWLADNPDHTTFTITRHPVERAYAAFMNRIFPTGSGAYLAMREFLALWFGVKVPAPELMVAPSRAALEAAGYGIGEHRAAFHAFLRFLKDNLAGQTSQRIDGDWASQHRFIAAFSQTVPVSAILKEKDLPAWLATRAGLQGTAALPDGDTYLFPLSDIYTQQTENLCRKAYATDYALLGYGPYQAA